MIITDDVFKVAEDAYHQNTHCYGDAKFPGRPLYAALEATIPLLRNAVLEEAVQVAIDQRRAMPRWGKCATDRQVGAVGMSIDIENAIRALKTEVGNE